MQVPFNYILTVALTAWACAQTGKLLLTRLATGKLVPERLVGAGGMPSAHSATVCALVMAVAREEGIASGSFAVAFVLAAVVMYDAMGVRRAAGEHAKIINKLLEKDRADENSPQDNADTEKELKEYLGHTPLEVLVGGLLGILVAMFYSVLHRFF